MRNEIVVVGGVYHEHCIWPDWDQIFGSGGRAATALVSHVEKVTLHTYARADIEIEFRKAAELYKFDLVTTSISTGISFDYVHCMSMPDIRPALGRIRTHKPIELNADAVLRFGMLEGSAKVDAKWCVYDPQSAFCPEPFGKNGSKAEHLAIVANRSEIIAMTGRPDRASAVDFLFSEGAEVVVVKSGPAGAFVYTRDGIEKHISAYQSSSVWNIGSGDVFAAIFAARWAVHGDRPDLAADVASRAVAQYAETMGLPAAPIKDLLQADRAPASTALGKVYLASPFFSLGQRWLVDEARRCFIELGLEVFSPVHDVGPGPAHEVGPADIAALNSCDRVFAILDGLDAGTIFEVGYARAKGIPVYVLAQVVSEENLKMVVGSGGKVYFDFVTALHHTAWNV